MRQMAMANGESDIYLGTDVGKWGAKGAGNFLWPAEGGIFFLPHVSIPKMLGFSWRIQMWVITTKKFRPPDPTSKSACGCWPIHLSPVTRGGGATVCTGTSFCGPNRSPPTAHPDRISDPFQ